MFPLRGFMAANQQVAKIVVAQYPPKLAERLLQDLFSMGDEQQGNPATNLPAPAVVVKSGDHGFAGPRRRHHQMPKLALEFAFRLEEIENLLLKGKRAKIEKRGRTVAGRDSFVVDCGSQTGDSREEYGSNSSSRQYVSNVAIIFCQR